MPTFKKIAIAISLSSSLFAAGLHAEETAPAAATKPAAMPAMPHPPMQASGMPGPGGMHPPAMPAGQPHPNGPMNGAQMSPASDLQLTDAQKQKMAEWRKVQQKHMQDNMTNQEAIEDLAAAEKMDNSAVKAAAEKMGAEAQKYYVEYAEKNHAFMASLSAEQRQKMQAMQKQRKEQMKQMREHMQQQMMVKPAPANPGAPAPAPAPAK